MESLPRADELPSRRHAESLATSVRPNAHRRQLWRLLRYKMEHPARASVIAAARPFGPEPTTTASNSSRMITSYKQPIEYGEHLFYKRLEAAPGFCQIALTCCPMWGDRAETNRISPSALLRVYRIRARTRFYSNRAWHQQVLSR